MPETLTVYLHFPCFDGVVSASLTCEFLERKYGWKTADLVPVDYSRRATWLSEALPKQSAVVDFLYHPDAQFWADHHQTTFINPQHAAHLQRPRNAEVLYDPHAGSCAEVIWRKAYRTLREPRFREMVGWAHRIDSAKYASVEEAVLGDAPALQISMSLIRNSSPEYCQLLVASLRGMRLAEVAALPAVTNAYKAVRRAIQNGQSQFTKHARIEDGVVVFRAREKTNRSVVSRYAPYLAYPKALYSIGIVETGSGAKITAMRNPWRRFKSVPLGQIFRRYGGGGHQRVASVLMKDTQDAERTLDAILADLRGARISSSVPTREATGDD